MTFNTIRIRPARLLKRLIVRGGRRPYPVRCGLFRGLTLQLDLQTETQVIAGLWERETYRYIRAGARDCAWMIDVGAGKGELCIFFLKRSRAEQVFAFEPQESEVEIFRRNLAANGERERERLSISLAPVGTSSAASFVALDALSVPRSAAGFIKIDVDGFELDVLHSGAELLADGKVSLLIETHSAELEVACTEWLRSRGYTVEIVRNAWWRLLVPEQRPIPHNRWLSATRRESRS